MNKCSIVILKGLRKIYSKLFKSGDKPFDRGETDPDKASDMIYQLLTSDKPCMIARFGSTELNCITNYISIHSAKHSIGNFIRGKEEQWWWNEKGIQHMKNCSGFFPNDKDNIKKFCQLMLEDSKEVDLLGSWRPNERAMEDYLPKSLSKVELAYMEPFWSDNPWSRALAGKKVLVIHPFAQLIENQYNNNRIHLFKNSAVLPSFELMTIQAVQSLGGESSQYNNWFDALQWMLDEMDKFNYDICLIGCGAYGFPLAAHAKRMGKKAIHLGGALQLLFGIRGKRWEDPTYGVKEWGLPYGFYTSIMNDYWIKPGDTFKPKNAQQVEGACYW